MSNEILYVLLPDFAAHEMEYLMEAIDSARCFHINSQKPIKSDI